MKVIKKSQEWKKLQLQGCVVLLGLFVLVLSFFVCFVFVLFCFTALGEDWSKVKVTIQSFHTALLPPKYYSIKAKNIKYLPNFQSRVIKEIITQEAVALFQMLWLMHRKTSWSTNEFSLQVHHNFCFYKWPTDALAFFFPSKRGFCLFQVMHAAEFHPPKYMILILHFKTVSSHCNW